MMIRLGLIALAGACGTLARYGIHEGVRHTLGSGAVWAAFAANMIGCLLFGLVWSLGESRAALSPETRTILLAGFMGAFTTFSTFIFDSAGLLRRGEYLFAFGNVAGQTVLGFACVFLGIALGRWGA